MRGICKVGIIIIILMINLIPLLLIIELIIIEKKTFHRVLLSIALGTQLETSENLLNE